MRPDRDNTLWGAAGACGLAGPCGPAGPWGPAGGPAGGVTAGAAELSLRRM